MQEELKEVLQKLNEISQKYNRRIDIETYEVQNIADRNKTYIYKANIFEK